MADATDWVPEPSDDDLKRIERLLEKVRGRHVAWGASSVLDVLLVERRLHAERIASERLARATWVLAGSTIVLALATVVLLFATIAKA